MLSILKANYKSNNYPIYISDNATKFLDIYLRDLRNNYLIICDDVFKDKKKHPDIVFSKILKRSKVYYFRAGINNKTIR